MEPENDDPEKKDPFGTGCLVVLLIFLMAACVFWFYLLAGQSLLMIIDAFGWQRVDCVIEASQVVVEPSTGPKTYRIDILYSYKHGRMLFYGDRYDFGTVASPGYERKARIVAAHPPGLATTCFVDPDDPSQSVISRSPGLHLLRGLLPLPFLAACIIALLLLLRPVFQRRRRAAEVQPTASPAVGSLTLEAPIKPLGELMGDIALALFFFGAIVPLAYLVTLKDQAESAGCGAVFTVLLFLLLSLWLLGKVLSSCLARFSPRPRLVFETARLETGMTCGLRWQLVGKADRLRSLTIRLQGREIATGSKGSSTSTDCRVFHDSVLVFDSEPGMCHTGTVVLRIPEGTMPSFAAPHNKIEWRILATGEIAFWPDLDVELPITIHPPARAT